LLLSETLIHPSQTLTRLLFCTTMSSPPPPSLKQRGPATKKRSTTQLVDKSADNNDQYLAQVQQQAKEAVKNEWDYKLALAVITVLAFVTRFWGITHPNQVVFDEVHFGKVSSAT